MKRLYALSHRRLACLTVLWLLPWGLIPAQLPAQTTEQAKDEKKSLLLREMRELVERFKVYQVDGTRVPAELVADPLLCFIDAVDRNQDGSLWIWGRTGRPSAIMQLWRDLPDGTLWFHSLTSLSSGLVAAEREDGWRWSPRKPGIELKPFSQPSTPAAKDAARLRQMKELARRFVAHEILGSGQRFELRLLVQPVHRYKHPQSGLIDGAIFILARGTDPEAALLVELVAKGSSPPAWRYGLASISSAELHVSLDDREVWQTVAGDGRPTDPYWLHWQPVRRQGLGPN
jgi:hypothetical protein